jgi:hypothetical protein
LRVVFLREVFLPRAEARLRGLDRLRVAISLPPYRPREACQGRVDSRRGRKAQSIDSMRVQRRSLRFPNTSRRLSPRR